MTPWTAAHQGIFQARVLEWVAISFSRGSFQPKDRTWVSHIVGRHFFKYVIQYYQLSSPCYTLHKNIKHLTNLQGPRSIPILVNMLWKQARKSTSFNGKNLERSEMRVLIWQVVLHHMATKTKQTDLSREQKTGVECPLFYIN